MNFYQNKKKNLTLIDVKDISTGGIRIESKYELMKGASLELTIPKLKTLDSTVLKCEVTRVQYVDGSGEYMIGLKFIPPNTDYLKQLVAAMQAQCLALTGTLMAILHICLGYDYVFNKQLGGLI